MNLFASKHSALLEKTSQILWGLVLLTLPVTSFRYFPLLGKHTYVRPLAFYPLALLYLVLMLRLLRKEIKLPWSNALIPFFVFLLVALLTTAAGAFLAPIELRGNDYWGRALRTLLTFMIGMAFFVAALWMNRDIDDVRRSLPWLYGGLVLTMLWAGVQATSFYTPFLKKAQVSEWQLLFSMRGIPKLRRVSGFAFEASWLAGQIATLYLPWLVASLLTRFRATKFRWLEPLLLLAALVTLFLTYSRGGLLIALAATGLTLLVAGRNNIQRSWQWLIYPNRQVVKDAKEISENTASGGAPAAEDGGESDFKRTPRASYLRGSNLAQVGMRVLIVLAIVGMLGGGMAFLAQQNYVNRLWTVQADNLADYFVKTNAGGRVTYLWSAVQVFLQHPFLGTGFGSSGFYLYQNLPDWALSNLPEVSKQLSPASSLYPNPKNLYLSILAENGIFGFVTFISFLFAILAQVITALRSDKLRLVGIAGLFSWTAILIYYMMQDSFAMAELWVNFGIILGLTSSPPSSSPRTRGENGGGFQEHL
mgnify:CR=1 FL=1